MKLRRWSAPRGSRYTRPSGRYHPLPEVFYGILQFLRRPTHGRNEILQQMRRPHRRSIRQFRVVYRAHIPGQHSRHRSQQRSQDNPHHRRRDCINRSGWDCYARLYRNPFGTADTSKDPEEAAKDLGVDVYPGASAQKQGASTATFGKVRTVSAAFESDDAVEKVCAFYKSKFPNATVSTSDQNRCTIVSNDPPNMITINVEPSGDGSKFQIASVSSKSK